MVGLLSMKVENVTSLRGLNEARLRGLMHQCTKDRGFTIPSHVCHPFCRMHRTPLMFPYLPTSPASFCMIIVVRNEYGTDMVTRPTVYTCGELQSAKAEYYALGDHFLQ
ncbi:hypothetical protein TNCV_3674961 [Trichonephila clavipes]|nr:hypothetical protein TNCV_3674961 [Trichonephila clavipes]